MTATTAGTPTETILRGVVLAGGTGSRLYPLTKVTNKHLLPVGREPMMFHPVRKLVQAGIRRFGRDGRLAVILGDNIFEASIAPFAASFRGQASGAKILVKEVPDPGRYGVAITDGARVTGIVEKPRNPPSALAVTGVYFYDETVFEVIAGLRPSARGELEITDVNNAYLQRGDLTFDQLPGWWTDAGTFESLKLANELMEAG